jgi:hypothetical protein
MRDQLAELAVTDALTGLGNRRRLADALGDFRLVVAEGPSMRELSERFWALGPARTITAFESYFA